LELGKFLEAIHADNDFGADLEETLPKFQVEDLTDRQSDFLHAVAYQTKTA
jgi:hypothetical protein